MNQEKTTTDTQDIVYVPVPAEEEDRTALMGAVAQIIELFVTRPPAPERDLPVIA